MECNGITQSLCHIANVVFMKISDKKILKKALPWSERSLKLIPKQPGIIDIYANLLYKLGNKKEAIAKEEEALRYVNSEDKQTYKIIEDTLRKMKSGEKTW